MPGSVRAGPTEPLVQTMQVRRAGVCTITTITLHYITLHYITLPLQPRMGTQQLLIWARIF